MRKRVVILVLGFAVAAISVILFTRPGSEPKVLWATSITANWVSPPTIAADGTLYLGEIDGNLCALAPDGTLRWKNSIRPVRRLDALAIGADDAIYAVMMGGEVAAFRRQGSLSWATNLGAPMFSALAIGANNTIYVGSETNKFYALNPDGSTSWEFKTVAQRSENAALGPDGTIYFVSRDALYALNADGSLKWACTNAASFMNHPIVGPDGTVYLQCWTNFCAIRPDGTMKWSILNYGNQHSALLDGRGTLYICDYEGVMALEAATGKRIWKNYTKAMSFAGFALASDRTVYFSGLNSTIYGLDRNGKLKWSFRRHPYLGDGALAQMINRIRSWRWRGKAHFPCGFTLAEDARLYAIMPDRKLYALEVPAGLDTNAPWPMFKHDVQHSSGAKVLEK